MSAVATRAAIIGRSMTDISLVWSCLQPHFQNADLIVTLTPIRRAYETAGLARVTVFLCLAEARDIDALLSYEEVPDGFFILCPEDFMQRCFADLSSRDFAVLALENAAAALTRPDSADLGWPQSARRRDYL